MLRGGDKKLRLGAALPTIPSQRGAAYAARVLADSPKAFWKCQDASGNPVDASGNANDMTTAVGTAIYGSPGPYATDSGIVLPAAGFTRAKVTVVTNNLTLEAWVRVANALPRDGSTNPQGLILGNSSRTIPNANGIDGYDLEFGNGRSIMVTCGNVANLTDSTTKLEFFKWSHVVATRDAGTWKYYINGALDATSPGSSAPIAPPVGATSHFGCSVANSVYGIAYPAIYETALSLAQVQAHYAALIGF